MVYDISELIKDIRIILDENETSDKLILLKDADTLSLNEIIQSKIVDAARMIEMSAPVNMLQTGENFGDAVYWNDDYSGWIILPDDFMRLIEFKMSDWKRPVYNPITESDPSYYQQKSAWSGIRGNPQDPIVAITMRPEGKILEFYSCDSKVDVEAATYVQRPIIRDRGIELCELCHSAIKYYTAALTAQTLGSAEIYKNLFETAKSLII